MPSHRGLLNLCRRYCPIRRTALNLEAVRRTGGSCCHDGATLCTCDQYVTKHRIATCQMCLSSSQCTGIHFRPWLLRPGHLCMGSLYDAFQNPSVGWEGDIPSQFPTFSTLSASRLTMTPLFLQTKYCFSCLRYRQSSVARVSKSLLGRYLEILKLNAGERHFQKGILVYQLEDISDVLHRNRCSLSKCA